ncbi:cation transporter [archaeon]|nr:MAG: cation transporter [archaeon]
MIIEIVCGYAFGSLALIADGLHMSTHVCAFLIAATAYSYARTHAHDKRFSFGTGKVGDLAGFTSTIILAIISMYILYDGVYRLINPTRINVKQAWPVAVVGLVVNILTGVVLMGWCGIGAGVGGDGMLHNHLHNHTHTSHPMFSIQDEDEEMLTINLSTIQTPILQETKEAYTKLPIGDDDPESAHDYTHDHDHTHHNTDHHNHTHTEHELDSDSSVDSDASMELGHIQDNNMRAAIIHVLADALVSILVLLSLCILAYYPKLVWLDPLVGCVGAVVIISWAYTLMHGTTHTLLDMTPHTNLPSAMRTIIQKDGSVIQDIHIWKVA